MDSGYFVQCYGLYFIYKQILMLPFRSYPICPPTKAIVFLKIINAVMEQKYFVPTMHEYYVWLSQMDHFFFFFFNLFFWGVGWGGIMQ